MKRKKNVNKNADVTAMILGLMFGERIPINGETTVHIIVK